MSEFTPTLSHFRAVYGAMCADWCRDGSLAEFDRVIAKIKADAWDEGADGALKFEGYEVTDHAAIFAANPYRIEGEA